MSGILHIVGIGPGSLEHLTPAARETIENASVIIGYRTYLELISSLAPDVPREASNMRDEVTRVRQAISLAANGESVALISSGDAGIYGMAGLVYEILKQRSGEPIPVEITPGITSMIAAAALIGAPLMNDFAAISLSDQLVPLDDILRRVEMAAQADFVIGFYNPKGKHRTEPLARACEILSRYRAPETPIGIVRAAYRPEQSVQIISLDKLTSIIDDIDMQTLIIIGNSHTYIWQNHLITPRGYAGKYNLNDSTTQSGH